MMMKDALAKSINTIAVKISLDVGREKVMANMVKLGITHLKKTCSVALGDQGMTPLEHTAIMRSSPMAGWRLMPTPSRKIRTLQGELLYSHERDEPARKQIFDRKAIETLNTMLQGVVTDGTGKAAQLDYTYYAGKTGTSSAYRDAWFMGFTGQYVAGVWLGNDDFTPMARVTGGSFPAQTWHNFMVLAHDTDNIPQIPGFPLHPVQVAEQERLREGANRGGDGYRGHRASRAGERQGHVGQTRQVLEKLGTMLKEAPALQPSDTRPQNRAEAPAAEPANPTAASPSSVASAAPGASPAEGASQPATPGPVATGSQTGTPPPP